MIKHLFIREKNLKIKVSIENLSTTLMIAYPLTKNLQYYAHLT